MKSHIAIGDYVLHAYSKKQSYRGYVKEKQEDGVLLEVCTNKKKKEINDTEIIFAHYDQIQPIMITPQPMQIAA